MATSQFRIYTSEDIGGPGPLNGLTGSLIPILDAVLVNGYGTGPNAKPSAGWTKSSPTSASVYTSYTMPSGSRFSVFINDAGLVTNQSGREAGVTGWVYVTSSASAPGAVPPAQMVGASGSYGQFPTPAQQLTYGFGVFRKSNTADNVGRSWIILADNYTMYMWALTGDAPAGSWYHWGFGDFYSFKGANNDPNRCMIFAGFNNTTNTWVDVMTGGAQSSGYYNNGNSLQLSTPGFFLANSAGGTGGSIACGRRGDGGVTSQGFNATVQEVNPMDGQLMAPNPLNGAFSFSPIWVIEPNLNPSIRGRWRGYYQCCHPLGSFTTGQTISGSGDYSAKAFMVITRGPNGGYWAMEVTNTVDTN